MIRIKVPGWKDIEINSVLSDLNGTLAQDGRLKDTTIKQIKELEKHVNFSILTANTHGTADKLKSDYSLHINCLKAGNEQNDKCQAVQSLGAHNTVFIGNGANDLLAMQEAVFSIGVIGAEGIYAPLIQHADIIVTSTEDALDLLLKPDRIIAGLRR